MSFHAAVWLDHEQARIFHIGSDDFDESIVHAPTHKVTSGRTDKGPLPELKAYFDRVVSAVGDAQEVLVLGPGTAKLDFIRHVHAHDARLAPRIVGVETVDHPTDGQLVAYIRKYFRAKDRMLGTP